MDNYFKLTREDIDTVNYEFIKVCGEIFELVDREKMEGVKCNSVEVHNNKIIAKTDIHYNLDFTNRKTYGKELYKVKVIAKRDKAGGLTIGSEITLDNKVEFIFYYKELGKYELEGRIASIKKNLYEPFFTFTEPLDYKRFKCWSNGIEKYERILLSDEGREFINSRFLGVCKEMFDTLDKSTAYSGVRIGDFYVNSNVIEEERDCIVTEYDWAGDPIRIEARTWFNFAKRNKRGKIVAGEEMTIKEKILFVYNYENWGLREKFYNKVNEDIINNTTISNKYVAVLRKILNKKIL